MKNRPIFPILYVGLILLFFYLPLLLLLTYSFNSVPFPARWEEFSFRWYYALFEDGELWSSLANSFFVATSSTTLCVLFTVCMIFYLSRGGRVGKYIPLFYGTLVLPETALAVGLLTFFSLIHIPLGLFTIIIAHTILGLGFMVPILYVKFQDIDQRILEASRMLGASSFQTFYKVVLPLLRPVIIITGLLIFILSFDDFVFAYFCAGSNAQTLSLFLVSSLRFGVAPNINALTSLLLIFTSVLVAIFLSVRKKERYL